MKKFFERLNNLFGSELNKNQGVIAKKLNTNSASFSRYLNGKTLPDVCFISNLALYKKLKPDELYELVTGIKYEDKDDELNKLKVELEQTKKELERERKNLDNLTTAIRMSSGQHSNGEDVGQRIKNIKHNTAADH